MVSNNTLAAICVEVDLYKYLQFDSMTLESQIEQYRLKLSEEKDREYANAITENRSPGQYWLDIEPPKASYLFHV